MIFKVGDKVRVVMCRFGNKEDKGLVGIVNAIDGDGDFHVLGKNGYSCIARVVKLYTDKRGRKKGSKNKPKYINIFPDVHVTVGTKEEVVNQRLDRIEQKLMKIAEILKNS